MIQLIPSAQRYHADAGWLSTYWHFSFGDYHDPTNMNWGPLRIFNDDIIRGGGGFGMHPHRDMEIITWVIEGELEHRDHLGHRGLVHAGEAQVMSAGRGIRHSEANASADKPVHLLQLWIEPRTKGLEPRWGQKAFDAAARAGKWLAVVTPAANGTAAATGGAAISDGAAASGEGASGDGLTIDQDATIYVARLRAGEQVEHRAMAGRRAYLFVISGQVNLNGRTMSAGDQARIADETLLTLRAESVEGSAAELMLLDLP